MKIKARMDEEIQRYELRDCIISDVVELDYATFGPFAYNMTGHFDFIRELEGSCWWDGNAVHCALVLNEDTDDGILMGSLGGDTADMTSYIPGARMMIEQYVDDIVQKIVEEGLRTSTNGNKSISNNWLIHNFDTQIINSNFMEPLFKKRLENHPDVESVTVTSNAFNLELKPESCLALDEYHQPSRREGLILQQLVDIGLSDFYLNAFDPAESFTPAKIPGLYSDTLTDVGQDEWDDVLQGRIGHIQYLGHHENLQGICYEVQDASAQRLMDFGNLLAGNCTQEQQELWVRCPLDVANGYEWPHLQDDQDDAGMTIQS